MLTRKTLARNFVLTLLLGSLAGGVLAAQAPAIDTEPSGHRLSTSTSHLQSDSANQQAWVHRQGRYSPLLTSPLRTGAEGSRSSNKTGAAAAVIAQAVNDDFWVYDAWVELSYDLDRDGYYTDFRLVFDADTYYSTADVYAVVYLSRDGGPWNEFAYTDEFTVYGSSPDDRYVIDTTLASGYPTGEYDLLIEIYDAYTGYLVADLGPEWADLSYLPLEDQDRDTVYQAPAVAVVVSHGGGGSMGWLMLGILLVAGLRRPNLKTAGRTH